MKITFFSAKDFEIPYIKEMNKNGHDLNIRKENLDQNTAELAKESDAVVLFTTDDASASVLDKLNGYGIKYIATRTAGFDHIDLEHAHELGMRVANVPKYSPNAIAEHAIGLMIALNRKLFTAQKNLAEYDFRLNGLIGFDMNGKTVGVLGAGKIGSIAVKILHGFGCKILIFDLVKNDELIEKYAAQYVDLDELCRRSDIITIHAPLNDKTKHIINKDTIDKMKDGVMLINAGRGKIIKTEDLIEGLKSGKIGSAGLDVYEYEKGMYFYDRTKETMQDGLFAQLLGFKNVILTGHQAFLTHTALNNMSGIAYESINIWEEGKDSPNEI